MNALPNMDIPIKPPALTDVGELVVFFSPEEIETSCRSFLYSLIAKCSYARPSIPEVQMIISSRFQVKIDFLISILDA